ncbi:aspartate transaminase [Marinomonas profundimaris]|uniref:Aminotransferase n=1 Tax=Marinomonas profundimaris TaxID=1208321 RepID=W1RVD1_9GAMM|nr:aspartate transaminase [Marinomonas profundimaris]ETI58778.1 aspartate aminotransferase [Marinomonas profundimaris]
MQTQRIASRVANIKPSPSSSAADRANELRQQGRDIISLVVGEPDFDTPSNVGKAAWEAIQRGETRYTANSGSQAMRQAIKSKLERENNLHYNENEIVVTNGAKAAIFTAFLATIEAGDEVVIPAPYWVSYPDMVIACEGTPVIAQCSEAEGFKLTAERLRSVLTDKTRWLIINSPSNPTGASYHHDDYVALAEVLADYPDVLIMTDDIYEHIRYDNQENVHLLNAAPQLKDQTVLINGVSKTYAMTGWRIGFAVGPFYLIDAFQKLQSQSAGNACSVSQAAAIEAYNGDQSFVKTSQAVYQQRRNDTLALINNIDGLHCSPPDGAFYLYVGCEKLIGMQTEDGTVLETDNDLVLYLLEKANVAVVAGSAYGLSPYFRMSIATSQTQLHTACERITTALAKLKQG